MKISISSGCFYFLPFEKTLDIFKASGFQYIEILGYWKDKEWEVGQNLKGLSYRQIKEITQKKGLKISAFHDPSGAIYNLDDLAVTRQSLNFTNSQERNMLVVHPPYSNTLNGNWWKTYETKLIEQYKILQKNYDICLENLCSFDDYKISLLNLKALKDFCENTNTFINLDFSHLIKSGLSLKESILRLNPLVKNVHISGVRKNKKVFFDKSEIPVLDFIKFLNLKKVENITIETAFEKGLTEKQYIEQCKNLRIQLEKAISNDKKNIIPFSKPTYLGTEFDYMQDAVRSGKISGNGKYTQKCKDWFKTHYHPKLSIITTSCTHALELAAKVCNISDGDEVIAPSFTFTATANAFVNSGAKIKFVDIKPNDMNIDETLIEKAITDKTKAIVVVHYAGVSCDMDKIVDIAKKYKLYLIEDAAQAILSEYNGQKVGTFGDIACFSFHATKNITMGEGGAFLLNNEKLIDRSICISDNGIDRRDFLIGKVERYEWMDKGSSYMASDLNAAFLFSQLEKSKKIIDKRMKIWSYYYNSLLPLHHKNLITLTAVSKNIKHNAHIFFIKTRDKETTINLLTYLQNHNIFSTFHYTPLHSTIPGKKYGEMVGKDEYTTRESYRLLRLPLYFSIKKSEAKRVVEAIYSFYGEEFI